MGLSVPVAFQYPEAAALLGRTPLGYLRSRGLKKYHSRSPKIAFPAAAAAAAAVRRSYWYRELVNLHKSSRDKI
jgi:hypothetical protein